MSAGCSTYTTERLSAFVDGELGPAEAAAVRAHAAGCAGCTAAIADLRVLIKNARALDVPEPPPTLWPSIEGALEPRGRFAWLSISNWRPFAVGALAGAVGAVLVVLGLPALRGQQVAETPSPPAETAAVVTDPLLNEAETEFAQAAAAYERSIAKLRTLLAREEARWSPAVRSRTAERLARLDEAIARSREIARRTPGDSAGNEQLFAAYQQKIAFLAAAVHRGGGEAGEWDKLGGGGR